MKIVDFVILRHGKADKNLGSTLSAQELQRAYKAGSQLDVYSINLVGYSILARAIQTVLAIVTGFIGAVTRLRLAEAIPAFGSDSLFAEMTAPSNFREVAANKGNFKALYDVHPIEKIIAWQTAMVAGFDTLFGLARDHETVLLGIHSPSVEMLLDGLMKRQGDGIEEELTKFAELDAVVVRAIQESEGNMIDVEILRKINAPALKDSAQR
jgi:broad specificity phosphatase PhoE